MDTEIRTDLVRLYLKLLGRQARCVSTSARPKPSRSQTQNTASHHGSVEKYEPIFTRSQHFDLALEHFCFGFLDMQNFRNLVTDPDGSEVYSSHMHPVAPDAGTSKEVIRFSLFLIQ